MEAVENVWGCGKVSGEIIEGCFCAGEETAAREDQGGVWRDKGDGEDCGV